MQWVTNTISLILLRLSTCHSYSIAAHSKGYSSRCLIQVTYHVSHNASMSPALAHATACNSKCRAHPAAHAILPQLGSCPKMAALVKEEAAIDLAILAAALSSGAPRAVTSSRQVAPSPSHAIDFARPYQHTAVCLPSLKVADVCAAQQQADIIPPIVMHTLQTPGQQCNQCAIAVTLTHCSTRT